MRAFFYAVGTAAEVRRRFDVPTDATLIVDAADQADRPLHRRPAWRKLVASPWRSMLRGGPPTHSALVGDLIIVPDLRTLGPFWRDRGKSLASALARKLIIRVLDVDGEPFELPAPLTQAAVRRLEQLAARSVAEFHRRRIRDGLQATRARGVHVGRPPFDWTVDRGRLVPNDHDLETIRDVCRQVDELGRTLAAIAEDLRTSGATLASRRPWTRKLLTRAWRYGVRCGWARPRRRPWDLIKRRLSAVA